MTKLSLVITTFNSAQHIRRCLSSVLGQLYDGVEIIAVDNGSSDQTVPYIQDGYPAVTLIRNNTNGGACRARNQGIAASSGEWVLVLDSDTVLQEGFLEEAGRILPGLPAQVGSVQTKIMHTDTKTIYSVGIALSRFFRRFYDMGSGHPDSPRFGVSRAVFGACAAVAFYRRSMLEDIKERTGYFDEEFFFLVEDVDVAWRAQRKGWKALYAPELVCFHQGNSSGYDRHMRQYLCCRNRWRAIAKNEGQAAYFLRLLPFVCYDIPRWFCMALTNPPRKRAI